MKGKVILPFTLLLFLLLFTYSIAETNYEELIKNRVDIVVDGDLLDTYDEIQQMDLPGFIYNNRTLLPLRKMFSIFGIEPEWNQSDRVITAEGNGKKIWLQIDNYEIKINDQVYRIDVPAKIFNNRTYVPVRFIAEAFGIEPLWDGKNRRVILNLNNSFVLEDWSLQLNIPRELDIISSTKTDDDYHYIKLSSREEEERPSSLSNLEQEIKVYRFDERGLEVIKSVAEMLPITLRDFKEVSKLEEKSIYFAEYNSNKEVKSYIFVIEEESATYLFLFSNVEYETCEEILGISK